MYIYAYIYIYAVLSQTGMLKSGRCILDNF